MSLRQRIVNTFCLHLHVFFLLVEQMITLKESDDDENTDDVISALQTELRFLKIHFGIDALALAC